MAEIATYFENAIVNLMRSTSFTEVAAYVALFTDSATMQSWRQALSPMRCQVVLMLGSLQA